LARNAFTALACSGDAQHRSSISCSRRRELADEPDAQRIGSRDEAA